MLIYSLEVIRTAKIAVVRVFRAIYQAHVPPASALNR